MVITDFNVGVLYAFALSSLGVYGVALGAGPPIPSTASWEASGAWHR